MSDYHVHLHPHGPAAESHPPPGVYPPGHLDAYVETALARGADEVGFTEHLYRCVEAETALGAFWEREPLEHLARQAEAFVTGERNLSLERYVEVVMDARERGLPVKLGLEVDYFPETIGAVQELLAPYPFDFLIGSVHWVRGWSIDHGDVYTEFDRRGVEQAWEDYFAVEVQLAASGAVDALAHVDVVKKAGKRPPVERVDLYAEVVKAAFESDTAVEVSSAGLRQPAAEIYPALRFLELFSEAGVPITLASDAHAPDQAAWGRDEVIAAARVAGYTHRLRFDQRRRIAVTL